MSTEFCSQYAIKFAKPWKSSALSDASKKFFSCPMSILTY